MMKEEVRVGIVVRRLRMRKNPVYILQSCARIVRSGALLTSYSSPDSTCTYLGIQ